MYNVFSLHVFFLISMGIFNSISDHAYFFLKSNLVPCLVHAYFFLKSNIAMLILVLEKSTVFTFFKEKAHISCFKAKISPKDKEKQDFG